MDSPRISAIEQDPSRAPLPARKLTAWVAFLQAHAATLDLLARELKDDVGLPLTWYDVLVQLSEAPEGQLRMQDLADSVLLSKSGLTRLIDRMENAGLVSRQACPSDRRGTFAALTEAGSETLAASSPSHMRGIRRHFAELLDDDEADTLERLMRRIADAARLA